MLETFIRCLSDTCFGIFIHSDVTFTHFEVTRNAFVLVRMFFIIVVLGVAHHVVISFRADM